MPSKKRFNRFKQFEDYKKKWGFTNYNIYVDSYYNDMKIYFVDAKTVNNYIDLSSRSPRFREIKSLHTLLGSFKKCKTIILHENNRKIAEFSSTDDLKHYFLIKKIVGI